MRRSSPKSAADWVKAAFRVLAREGAEGVRVEPLAAELGVTKGSFYWHFADRAALLSAILNEWERLATEQVIALVDGVRGSPRERLLRLLEVTLAHPRAAAIEQAIRAWAAREHAVRHALERVDARRVDYVRDLLVAGGVERRRAIRRSQIMYLALLGEYVVVSHGGSPRARAVWEELADLALAKPG
jgi:AcrR family transcriptional regulator